MEGHREVSELLVAAGGDINTQDDDGVTPLIATTGRLGDKKGSSAEVMIAIGLINGGSDLNMKNKHRKTALMCAIDSGNEAMVTALRKAGAQ